jgi:hypothetical protein
MRSLAVRRRRGFFGVAEPVQFEVRSDGGTIRWAIEAAETEMPVVISNLRASVPAIRLEPEGSPGDRMDRGVELRLSSQVRALRTDVSEQAGRALLEALVDVRPDEAVVVDWLVGPWLVRPVVPSTKKENAPGDRLDFRPKRDSEELAAQRRKQAEPVFGVVGRILVRAGSASRQRQLLQRVLGALQLVREPGVGFRRRLMPSSLVPGRAARRQRPLIAWPSVLGAGELAAVVAWPIGAPAIRGVRYDGQRQLPAPERALSREPGGERVTGRATYPGHEGYLVQRRSDALRHTWVIGPTGVGKSTLLANLVLADITDHRGAVVVDPKGDLVADVLDRVPVDRERDVVVVDAGDLERPVGLNPLSGRDPDLAVDTVLHIMRELYAAYWGPRTSDVLHAGLLTLARKGTYTLVDLPALLVNAPFRRSVAGSARQDTIGLGPFWSWYEALSDAERGVVIGPAMNKLRAFTLRPALRLMLGQVDGFDLLRVFSERKVLLVNLNKGAVGSETAQLLGSLLLGQLWQAIQRRSRIPRERRHPVVLYLDEFHDYLRLPNDLGDVLVQARGLGVGVVAAHQHLGQLAPAIRSAVAANAQTRIVFGLGYDDAAVMARVLGGGLSATDIQNLAAFETYQALCVSGSTASPASAVTVPLSPSLSSGERVRQISRATYGTARAEVEAALLGRRKVEATEAPIGARKRSRPGDAS